MGNILLFPALIFLPAEVDPKQYEAEELWKHPQWFLS